MTLDLDHLPIAAAYLELDGTFVEINPIACKLLGRDRAAMIGTSIFEVVPALATLWDPRMTELRAQGAVTTRAEVVTATGLVTIQHTHALIVRAGRELVQAYGFDLTEHEVAQQLATKHRNESLGLVAGGVAHDFNNLLVGVLAEASALSDDPQLTGNLREAMKRIEASAKQMAQLTRQLLAYAGRGRVVTSLVDPDELVRGLVDPIARAVRGDVQVRIAPAAGTVAVEADPLLLRQIVLNLVSNAAEAVGPDGHVTILSEVCARDGASWWQLEVGDDGIGLDAATRARIFDPFFTTKVDHHGLGLSAVQGIVRRLAGYIEVDSAAGQGARFRVRLPIVPGAQAAIVPRMPAAVRSPLVGIRVLIADDEPTVRSTVRRLFERRGAHVSVAADGTEAEALLRAERFGFVLLDVEMPGRRGYELVPIVRETQAGTPVLLMSGFTDTHGHVEPDGFLEKPFTSRALDAMLDELLAKPH